MGKNNTGVSMMVSKLREIVMMNFCKHSPVRLWEDPKRIAAQIMFAFITTLIVRLSLLRKTILIPEYLAFMCVCVFVDGCISQF